MLDRLSRAALKGVQGVFRERHNKPYVVLPNIIDQTNNLWTQAEEPNVEKLDGRQD